MKRYHPFTGNSRITRTNDPKDTFLEFALNALLEQPSNVYNYAENYFKDCANRHTPITYDYRNDTQLDEPIMSSFDLPRNAIEAVRRGRMVSGDSIDPEKISDDSIFDVYYGKDDEQKKILTEVVSKCILFRSLEEDQIERIIRVMFPVNVLPGTNVIRQFDEGDNFYIIENGHYDVFMANNPGEKEEYVCSYVNEGHFGELALLYDQPRAATVKATSSGRLWAMDRNMFRKIVVKHAYKKRKQYEHLIQKVDILQSLTQYEAMNLADALVSYSYADCDIIYSENDRPDGMYFIESGTVAFYIRDNNDRVVEFRRMELGDYFGQLDLVMKTPRTATAVAIGDVKVAFLDIATFERLLGSCVEVIKRDEVKYTNLLKEMKHMSAKLSQISLRKAWEK